MRSLFILAVVCLSACFAQTPYLCDHLTVRSYVYERQPRTSNGSNTVALVLSGSVGYINSQARSFQGPLPASSISEFVPLGPSARLFQRHFLDANDGAVDIFLFSWAPLRVQQAQLLSLYRPLHYRFENQSEWLGRFRQMVQNTDNSMTVPDVSQYVSRALALEMVWRHEANRGWRYDRVVLTRPDAVLGRDLRASDVPTGTAVYHNTGNHNAQDQLFVMSSIAAQKFACIPSVLRFAENFGRGGRPQEFAHWKLFLPVVIPLLTGLPLNDTLFPHSASKNPQHDLTNYRIWTRFRRPYCNGTIDSAPNPQLVSALIAGHTTKTGRTDHSHTNFPQSWMPYCGSHAPAIAACIQGGYATNQTSPRSEVLNWTAAQQAACDALSHGMTTPTWKPLANTTSMRRALALHGGERAGGWRKATSAAGCPSGGACGPK